MEIGTSISSKLQRLKSLTSIWVGSGTTTASSAIASRTIEQIQLQKARIKKLKKKKEERNGTNAERSRVLKPFDD